MTPSAVPSRRDVFLAAAAGAAFGSGCGAEARHPERLRYLLRRHINPLDPITSPEDWILDALFEPLIAAHPETHAAHGWPRHPLPPRKRRDAIHLLPSGTCRAARDATGLRRFLGQPNSREDAQPRLSKSPRVGATEPPSLPKIIFFPGAGISIRKAPMPTRTPSTVLRARKPSALEKSLPSNWASANSIGSAFRWIWRSPRRISSMLCHVVYATPRHVIEQARRDGREAAWTEPERIATSGPFRLKECRPHERTVVSRNPYYFDSAFGGIEEIEFSAADGMTVVNLFRAGLADSMEGRVLPLQLAPRLKGQPALHVRPACASHGWRFSRQPSAAGQRCSSVCPEHGHR